MSRIALATQKYEEMSSFYQERLGFILVQTWDREGARGGIFSGPGGIKLEILDAVREKRKLNLREASERIHLVLEVEDVGKFGQEHGLPGPEETGWGGRILRISDPDGWPVVVMGLGG